MSVHTHKVFNPMLILKNTGGAKIFDSDTGESSDVTGSDGVTVWAEISDDNIMIEFDIPEDKSLSTTTAGSFIVPVKAIGMCSKSTVGDYKLESDSDVTAVSSEPTVTVTLAECPQITGVSFSAKMGEGLSIAVAWTGFSNPSNVPVTRLSPLKIKTASESEYAALYGILNNPPNQTVDGDQNTVVKLEYDDGEYILTFTQLQAGAFPTSGSFSFASYAEEMACDSTSNYRLEAADPLFLSVTDANNNAGASAVYEAEMCQYNTFSSISLSVNADTVNPAAGTASLRVQWLNFKDNIGFNGDDVMVISPGEDNPGFFTGVDNIVTIFASDKTPAAGITAAASFDSNSGNFVVSITKSMGATFPAYGYFDIFPTRITGIDAQEMPCNTFAMHNVSSADSSNLLLKKSAESLSVEFVWSWCPITFKNAEVEFELDSNGAASVIVSWESLTMASESPLSPELVLTMNNGLFKAQALHLTVNANASYPATAKIVTDGGPMTLSFSTATGTALPLSGTMVFNLEFIDSLITCASVSTGSITLESSNTDFATIINTNMALLSVDVRTPACPTMTGVTVTQTSTGVRLEWQGYRNDDSLTLKETMVSLKIAPATTTGVVVFEAAKFPETYVLIEENKLTFAAYLTHDNNGLYITFSQTGTQDSFPTSGSVSFDTVLVAKCDIVNAAQKLSPEDTTGLGMYIVDNSNPVVSGAVNFIASTPRCISAFSGVRLTAPYDDDVNNTLAAIKGSVGFRFSWTGFKSDATIFENMVKISYADVATMSSSLIDDAASALAALYNPTGTVNADWAVTAVVADSTITLSFVYIGADATAVFPTAAYVDVEPPRSQQSHSCDASEVFLVAEMDSSSFAPIDGDNDALVSTYVWANCPISFDTMALSAFVDAGKAKLAVSWAGVTVSTFNTASPTLQINLESGTQVYDSEWGPETVVLNSDVRATAKSIAGVITITFSIVNGATMPADADFVFVPKINETAHSCSQTFTGSYIISSANTAIATVSNSIDTTLVATEARAAACPSVSGMSLTLVGSTFTVSWTDFENTDNIPMEDFSDYSILFSGSTAAVFNALSGSTAPINVGANVDVAVTFSNAGFHFAFSGTGTNTIPAPGFFSFDAVQSQKCGLASEYTLGVDESNVSGFSGSDLTVSASTEVCPDPAEFRGVSVTSEIDGDNYNAIFTWTGFINKMSVSLKSSFSFASSDGSSDAFNLEAPATVTLTSAGASVAGIATVIVDDGAYIVSFAPTTDSPMPVNGLLTLSLKLSTGATCGVTSHFLLSSGSDSSVILHAASAGSMSASYTSKQCPAVFTGLAIESDEMTLTGNSGFVVSWLTYSNKDKVALTNVFTIERANTSHANPFTGLSITKVQVLNEHYAIVDGVTAGLAYNNVTGAITVSFTFSGNAELPTEGSFVVRPTLDSAVACETVSSFALSTNAALVTATSHGAFTADFNMAVCTVVTGVKVTKSSVTTSTLTLALSYFTFQQGAAEGKITLTSSIAALYSDNSELPISVTASSHSFTAITITGNIASGVITIPLSDKLPTAEGSLQFSLTLAVTDDCDRSATLVPAKVGTITMDLAAGFSSLETPGLACTYDWRCTGISNGAAAEGLVCSTSDATQFSTTCSNNCGTGTRPLNAPYCSRLNNNAYKATADTAKCATAKPTLTLSCTDNSCPNAMWKCYAAGTTNTAVDCVNNGGYSACASFSGCHTNPSVERIAVCVADSTSTTDIEALCPSLVSQNPPVLKKACGSNTETCAMKFNTEDQCYINNQVVTCGAATRTGVCYDTASSATVDSALCTDASLSLTQACANVPTDCTKPASWRITQSATCATSTAPLCKSIRTQTSDCAFVNASGSKVAAAAYLCDAASKPPAYVTCDAPEATCATNGGTCTGNQSFKVGDTTYDNVLATCVCNAGYFGAMCSSSIKLSELTVAWNKTTRAIDVAWTTNAAAVAGAKVSVLLTLPGYSTPSLIEEIAIGALSTSISAATHSLSPGTYTVAVFYSTSVTLSASVTVYSLCDAAEGLSHSCANGGTCDNTSGQCMCKGAWSGSDCSVSPCAGAACNSVNTASCTVEDDQAKCNCRTGTDGTTALFKGALCNEAVDTGACATLTCYNGGLPLSVYDETTSTVKCAEKCICPTSSPFGGDTCNTCKNSCSMMGTSGSISSQCKCKCKPGYKDDNCGCRFANLHLVFPRSALPFLGTSTEAAQLALWSAALKADARTLGGKTTVVYSIASVRSVSTKSGNFVNVLINAGPDCNDDSQQAGALPVAFASHLARLRPPSAARFTAQAVSAEMADTYAALKAITDALSAGQAITTTTMSMAVATNVGITDDACGSSCEGLPASTGTGAVEASSGDETDSSSGGSNDADIIAGVVVGVGGFLIIAGIVIFLYYKKLWCFSNSSIKEGTEAKSADLEMTATGTGYDV